VLNEGGEQNNNAGEQRETRELSSNEHAELNVILLLVQHCVHVSQYNLNLRGGAQVMMGE